MLDLAHLTQYAAEFARSEIGRIGATAVVAWVAARAIGVLQQRARTRCVDDAEFASQRGNFVVAKNLILLLAAAAFVTIWASKIAGAALSVAAVTGAILLVTKDFSINLLGTAVLALGRIYRVGDFIEIKGISGRVVDTSMLNTTVADTPHGNLVTGSVVTFPNALLLTEPVRNLTATGKYVVRLLSVSVAHADAMRLEPILLRAGHEVCAEWIEASSAHFRMLETRELLDLPSGSPKVIIDISNHQHALLTLRYACRPDDRVTVEQQIMRHYLSIQNTLIKPGTALAPSRT